ncbi:MAG: 3'-5' exonuclease [Burkholderiales bacterium]
MTPVLAFDIETVPDCAGIRRLYGLPDALPDEEVAEVAFQKRRTQTGSDFLAPHLHRVVAIACVMRGDEGIQVFSLGEPERDEKAAIQKFFAGIDKLVPQIVSWNGRGFDLPVLAMRALLHRVGAAQFWDTGGDNKDFRWNNYINRFHERHLDLMDVLSLYGGRGAPLDEVARLAGFPGKTGMGGAEVWDAYLKGRIAEIRAYCEADSANTYLLYLRFQLLRGAFTSDQYGKECALLRGVLEKHKAPHWREFLSRWSG